MTRILSTYLFIKRKLSPALVAEIARSGVTAIELFCARGHFDYRSADAVRELGGVLRDHNLALHAVHAPAEHEFNPKHESGTPLSISDPDRTRRGEAVDEIKRALDIAEQIPFRYLVQHMGSSRDAAEPRRFDAAFNSLEHLHIFAKQRGVSVALENTPGELATPANLRQFIADTRLNDLRLCFDIGHAHIGDGVPASLEAMRELIVTSHIHDNHGDKDEHLLPYDGTIDWKATLVVWPSNVPLVLELKEQPAYAEPAPASVALEAARGAFDKLEQELAASQGAGMNPGGESQGVVVTIDQIGQHEGEEITLQGWLYNQRESGKLLFPIFRDGTGILQGVVSQKEQPEAFEALRGLTQESSVIVTGRVRKEARAPGGYEMGVTRAEVVQRVSEAEPYPIQLKEHGVDFLLDRRHLWIRTPRQASILRIRAEAIRAAREFMDSQGYTLTDAPIFTPAACEGTTTLFEVQYVDDEKAYLTQSGQLYIEATAAALGKVYCFGPTFRAEKSKTRRHLTEFWMLEPEAYYAHLEDMMDLGEGLVSHVVQSVVRNRRRELETLKRDVSKLETVQAPFPRMTYDEAIGVLQKGGNPAKWGDDFGGDEETILSSQFDRPVMIHRYPAAIKAFYMEPDPVRPELALGFDMLAPEGYGEIIGGGERVSSYDLLVRRLRENHLPEEAFQWYLDLRRYGSAPHAGFGLGLERTVAWICGTEHIREVIPFPRMIYRVYP